ncbi:hypothetical protein J7M28_06050 [bacterium]|nr:hypothetical protein [bacterium]
MDNIAYRISVWKGEKVPAEEGGTLATREFKMVGEAIGWLKRCEGECEVYDLSVASDALAEERPAFSGPIPDGIAALRAWQERI